MLHDGRADLAIYTGPRLDDPAVHVEKLRDVTFGLYTSPDKAATFEPQAAEEAPVNLGPGGIGGR